MRHLIVPLLFLIAPLLLVIVMGSASVLIFRYKKGLMRAVDPVAFPNETKLALAMNDWAEEQGFRYIGSYQVNAIGSAYVAAWERDGDPTYFCVYYLADKLARDFVTVLDGTGGLTTGNSADGSLFPTPPGEYKQTFPGVTIEDQWRKHGEALAYLKHARSVSVRSDFATFGEAFNWGMREPMKHVMSLFLWPLRMPYWYFVRRTKTRGLTVEEMIRNGWTR